MASDIALTAVTAAGYVLAALFFGLWRGEIGRRRTAENWTVHDRPDPPPPAEMKSAPDAEERALEAADSRPIQRLKRDLKRMRPDLTDDKLDKEAHRLMGEASGGS